MKIAQIAPPWLAIPPKTYGGTESVIFHLVEELVALGHDVTLFAAGTTQTSARLVSFLAHPLLEDGVPWHAHLKAYYHLHCAVEEIAAQQFDIVHTHLSSSADLYTLPLLAGFSLPHLSTLHSHFPFDRSAGGAAEADRDYMARWGKYTPIVAISESARRVESKYVPHFVGVVHHGISLEQYVAGRRQPGENFAWVGRFMPEKGAHLAIEAAKRAGVPLILAGTIDRYSSEARNYFHNVIQPQVDHRQIKYIGPVNMKEKVRLLSRARGFLNPIEWEEPFGMVMIEAMAVGCPVITFTRGAAPELVVHGKTGFLVQDLDEMVQYIPRIGEIDRAAARQHVEQQFSVRVMAENYIRMYQKVIEMFSAAAANRGQDGQMTGVI